GDRDGTAASKAGAVSDARGDVVVASCRAVITLGKGASGAQGGSVVGPVEFSRDVAILRIARRPSEIHGRRTVEGSPIGGAGDGDGGRGSGRIEGPRAFGREDERPGPAPSGGVGQ